MAAFKEYIHDYNQQRIKLKLKGLSAAPVPNFAAHQASNLLGQFTSGAQVFQNEGAVSSDSAPRWTHCVFSGASFVPMSNEL
ncbi:IS3 family transposase [Rhizobium azibense]|uniref:IS3 family transposase n=1 Tax=Rhizobium azibense TaxID=1136135 RepID=UPI003CCB6C04